MAPSNFWIEEANEAEMVEPVSWECVELTPPFKKIHSYKQLGILLTNI
jgi:hypothetical protein